MRKDIVQQSIPEEPSVFGAQPTESSKPYLNHNWDYSNFDRRSTGNRRELVLHPLASLKLYYFLFKGDTEIGAFGISDPIDPLYVLDLHIIPQKCYSTMMAFEDTAIAQYLHERFEETGNTGLPNIWIHTHPNITADPSITDESTFRRHFQLLPWSVMAIISKTHDSYARLSVRGEWGFDKEIPFLSDWSKIVLMPSGTSVDKKMKEWGEEYDNNITKGISAYVPSSTYKSYRRGGDRQDVRQDWRHDSYEEEAKHYEDELVEKHRMVGKDWRDQWTR